MIKINVEVIENFNLKAFDKLENIKRAGEDIEGKLFVGDTFDCDEDMYDYLMGNNSLNKAVIKKIKIKEIKDEVSEEQVQAVANAIVEEAEEQNKKVEEIVNEIVEESKEEIPILTEEELKEGAEEQAKMLIEEKPKKKKRK